MLSHSELRGRKKGCIGVMARIIDVVNKGCSHPVELKQAKTHAPDVGSLLQIRPAAARAVMRLKLHPETLGIVIHDD